MADYPKSIVINEEELTRLTATYQTAYKSIYDEIAHSTSFGIARRKQILAQIEAELTVLGVNTTQFIADEIPKYYAGGADDAVGQLKNIYADVAVKTGFNRFHKDAIQALVNQTAEAFGESIGAVNRNAKQLMSIATKETITQQLATGNISGEALRKVQQQIIGTLQTQGLNALVDKAGRGWTLDRYTDMLVRTKFVEARNTGLTNRLVENGYDLVQVSKHGATDICREFEGKIYSITGKTPGYKKLSDVISGTERLGLFHPNCRHAINALTLGLARETMSWNSKTREYEKGIL
jgi:hypothetical protein